MQVDKSAMIGEASVRWPVVNALASATFNHALETAQGPLHADPPELVMALQLAFIALIAQLRNTQSVAELAPVVRAQCEAMCQEFEDGLIPVDFSLEGN